MLDEETAPRVLPFKRRNFWYGALTGAGAMAAAASVAFLLILPPSAETLAQSITDDHTAALTSGHLIQIASSSHHVVKPWFAGKVDVVAAHAGFHGSELCAHWRPCPIRSRDRAPPWSSTRMAIM
ncbi:MAG: hypothetical protein WDM89_11565 [Rhizomicrobium sp.]